MKNNIKMNIKHKIFKLGSKILDLFFVFLPYTHKKVKSEAWDMQYSSGRWNYLREINELSHYSVISGYCHYFKPTATILDVGCGDGFLQENLHSNEYSRYVGVDISEEAIRMASKKESTKTMFAQADVTQYVPEVKFDIIIFNEILYYLNNPLTVLNRYEKYIEINGYIIVSMHLSKRNKRVWRMLEKKYVIVDEVSVKNKAGISWVIKVFSISSKDS